jgi:hypothetical protein
MNANEKPDNKRPPADNNCADECPKYVEPLVRVAVSEAEQSTKCSRD